jgi:hypothetical protein
LVCDLLAFFFDVASWFPGVYDEFLVKPQSDYQYTLWLIPLSKNEDIASVAGNLP